MTYVGRHRAPRPERSLIVSKLITTAAAASLLACTLLTGPPADAITRTPHRQPPRVVKPIHTPCPPHWYCISPIERPSHPPRLYRP